MKRVRLRCRTDGYGDPRARAPDAGAHPTRGGAPYTELRRRVDPLRREHPPRWGLISRIVKSTRHRTDLAHSDAFSIFRPSASFGPPAGKPLAPPPPRPVNRVCSATPSYYGQGLTSPVRASTTADRQLEEGCGRAGDLPVPVRGALRPGRVPQSLAMTASAPGVSFLSRPNGWPARSLPTLRRHPRGCPCARLGSPRGDVVR
jgi:hypothetical protein